MCVLYIYLRLILQQDNIYYWQMEEEVCWLENLVLVRSHLLLRSAALPDTAGHDLNFLRGIESFHMGNRFGDQMPNCNIQSSNFGDHMNNDTSTIFNWSPFW